MRLIILSLLIMALFACNQRNSNQVKTSVPADTNITTPVDSPKVISTPVNSMVERVYIKDKSKYSQIFINELKASNYPDPIKVIDNYMIVGADTTAFPNDIKPGKSYAFTAKKDDQLYDLSLKRINETTLSFDFKFYEKDSLVYKESGNANLSALFFLASENDDDDQTNDSYGVTEYSKKSKYCWFKIRLGIGRDDQNKLRATINKGCENKSKTPEITASPTLRTK